MTSNPTCNKIPTYKSYQMDTFLKFKEFQINSILILLQASKKFCDLEAISLRIAYTLH